jgi:hypothetical protein
MSAAILPRGIRNKNPGNIVKSSIEWFGEKTSLTEDRFETFGAHWQGLRALCACLLSYQAKHACWTVDQIVRRWSTTDQAVYVSNVAEALGVKKDDNIILASRPDLLAKLCTTIVKQENGMQPYPVQMINKAVDIALGRRKPPMSTVTREELSGVTAADLASTTQSFENAAGMVDAMKQPDGSYKLTVNY